MTNTYVAGFDFGTTNSLISFVQGNRPINCLDEEQLPTPSMVCYEGERKMFGGEAKKRLSQAGLGIQGSTVRSPKMLLGKENVFVEGIEKSPVEIAADVVDYVHQQAGIVTRKRGNFSKFSSAVVTIPVGMQGYERRALRNAFRMSGLRIEQFVHEPFAALYGLFRGENFSEALRRYDNKLILVFDWGGGTLDLTLCRIKNGMIVQVKNDGTDEVGGDVFDETIMNHVVQSFMESRKVHDFGAIQQGAKSRLLDRCERAKIDLSSRSTAQIYVDNFFMGMRDDDIDHSLSRDEFEEVVKPLFDKGFQRIERVLNDAGYSPEQIALCVATGGMSNVSVVSRRLHELFGPERVKFPENSATLIAEGAAWIAFDHASLQLAKNFELELARNSYLSLVKAGTTMPREGEVRAPDSFHLYCTDPRDGIAKFQFCSPVKPGPNVLRGEPRVYLENITVKVDSKARAFMERLELDVQIDENLIVDCHARSLNICDEDRCEIHDLEFGLKFSDNEESTIPDGDLTESIDSEYHSTLPDRVSGISVRANISDREDDSLVPGEFLAQYNKEYMGKRGYFDQRNKPPRYQVEEKLYYRPCAICGRATNDPACKCEKDL